METGYSGGDGAAGYLFQGQEQLESALDPAVEALLFAADRPLSADEMASCFMAVTQLSILPEQVVESIDRLNRTYGETGRAFKVQAWAEGYRIATRAAYAPYIRQMTADASRRKLSRTLLETLAVFAYKQPVTKAQVDFVRGVDSDYSVKKLLEMGLIDVVGRSEAVGRPLVYGTTPRFLDQFGLNSLSDLPGLREIEELLNDPLFSREKARLLTISYSDDYTQTTSSDNGEIEIS